MPQDQHNDRQPKPEFDDRNTEWRRMGQNLECLPHGYVYRTATIAGTSNRQKKLRIATRVRT